MNRRIREVCVFGLIAWISACGDSGVEGGKPAVQVAASDDGAFAGSASCRECHEEVYKTWAASHHGQAERPVDSALDGGAFDDDVDIVHGSLVSHTDTKDGTFRIVTQGADGEVAPHPVARAIGVSPLRQYLVETEPGWLQTAALSYDPALDEWFDVFGEEDRRPEEWGHWTQRGMNWNSMCADCHNTDVRKGYDAATDTYETTMVELGVGCESCHGPSANHVTWQKEHPDGGADPTLGALRHAERPERWLDTCGACHSRRTELQDVYRAGESFLDSFLPELPGLHALFYPDGQVLEEDYEYGPFLLSRMHHNGVTCVSCHDPHAARPKKPGNALCLECHSGRLSERLAPIDPAKHSFHAPGTPGGNCVDCHMPLTTYMQRHPRHDHGFTVPDPLLTQELGIPNACNRCHQAETTEWARTWVDTWYGDKMERPQRQRARLVARARERDRTVVPELVAWIGDEPYPAWRAVAAKVLAASIDEEAVVAALVQAATDDSALVRAEVMRALEPLGAMLQPVFAARLEDEARAVRVTAAWALRASIDLSHPAARELVEYLDHNIDQPLGAAMKAAFWLDRGDARRAVTLLERAVAWDSGSAEFSRSLGVALSSDGRIEEAVAVCEEGCERHPEDVSLWFSLALGRAELSQLDGAVRALERTVALDETFGRAWYNLGLARHQLGDAEGGRSALERATQAEPNSAEFWYGLASVCRDLGDVSTARFAARKALEVDARFQPAQRLLETLVP